MCDNDYKYQEIGHRLVKSRKRHRCGSCEATWPRGTMMQMRVGKTDGDIGRTYGCPVCEFALAQPDHSPLHLCWGWNWDGDGSYGKPVWDYIFFCLDNNETPSATAWEAVHRQHQELHLQENSA